MLEQFLGGLLVLWGGSWWLLCPGLSGVVSAPPVSGLNSVFPRGGNGVAGSGRFHVASGSGCGCETAHLPYRWCR